MPHMCRIFESLVGAMGLSLGFINTLAWLRLLFDPWIQALRRSTESSSLPTKTEKKRYEARMFHLRADSSVLKSLKADNIPGIIGSGRNMWKGLDSSRVEFGKEYPPALPIVDIEPHILTAVLTDLDYSLHWGKHVNSNQGFRSLGLHLYRAVLTASPIEDYSWLECGELDDIRTVCTGSQLVARLGLLYNLNKHTRTLRRVGDNATWISQDESETAFYALVGLVYVKLGWTDLYRWLKALLAPWIAAFVAEDFAGHEGAQNRRRLRLEEAAVKERKTDLRQKKLAEERAVRQCGPDRPRKQQSSKKNKPYSKATALPRDGKSFHSRH
ncbi:hypothetical protein FB45DRAFT_902228 [Roridomyces roridus]|uniref:RNase III domain-containing protein n=1 Tax=Roridomyces roridus TaxID=1738132 RepID=A0AAD7FTA9_9AGAR|nr:hypothetical protein FB45DRAFT_902228 [Roridomyces roridus]